MPPKPIDDLAGRIAQARTIAAYRGIPVAPLTADEISALRRKLSEGTPQEREALLAQLNSMSKDMKAAVNPSLMASDGSTPKDTKLVPANYTASDDSQQRAEIGQDGAAVDVAQAKPGASPQTTPAQQKPPQVPAAPNSGGPNVLPPTPAQRNRNTLDNWARIPGSRQKTELPMPEDWRGRLPPAILDAINKEAETYGVPPELLARILWKESTFNEKAGQGTRKQGQGIAGISKDAINQLLKNNENNPERKAELERYAREDARMQALPAISMAAEYLRHNFDRLGRSWVSAVAGYTAGETRIRRFLQGQPEWRDAGLTKGYLSLVFDGNASRFDSYQ